MEDFFIKLNANFANTFQTQLQIMINIFVCCAIKKSAIFNAR